MRAGAMDRRITVQKPGASVDPEYGPQPGGWENVLTRVSAQVLDTLPSRAENSGQVLQLADQPARVRIRYTPLVTADMRVLVHGRAGEPDRVYEIVAGPAEIGRREWLEFMIKAFTS
jgi:head-tail adaptor